MKEFSFKINGTEYKTAVTEKEGGITEVTVNGKTYNVEMEHPQHHHVAAAPKAAPATAAPKAASAAPAAGGMQVKSPLPGSIIKVLVSEGQAVKKGDILLTLESMKMENTVAAECDGTVKQIAVTAGQNVMQDDLLVVLG
ncbi:MAG: biotin/lipoyl-binding protein [Paludibacteraceae bacterium]|nr:biotin/lipoyl-binding protein [Paludibacteraceae bacterium]